MIEEVRKSHKHTDEELNLDDAIDILIDAVDRIIRHRNADEGRGAWKK